MREPLSFVIDLDWPEDLRELVLSAIDALKQPGTLSLPSVVLNPHYDLNAGREYTRRTGKWIGGANREVKRRPLELDRADGQGVLPSKPLNELVSVSAQPALTIVEGGAAASSQDLQLCFEAGA